MADLSTPSEPPDQRKSDDRELSSVQIASATYFAELPSLLEKPEFAGQWVAYCGKERLGPFATQEEAVKVWLNRSALERGIFVARVETPADMSFLKHPMSVESPECASPRTLSPLQISSLKFFAELPTLLATPGYPEKWVAYHLEERLGPFNDEHEALRAWKGRGIPLEDVYLGFVEDAPEPDFNRVIAITYDPPAENELL